MSLYQDALAFFMEKSLHKKTGMAFYGTAFSPQLPNNLGHPGGAQSLFPTGCNVLMRQPRAASTFSLRLPFRRPGENRDTYISCSGWSLPMVYRLVISITVRPREKNRKNKIKDHPLSFAIFSHLHLTWLEHIGKLFKITLPTSEI